MRPSHGSSGEVSGVTLGYVAREIEGNIPTLTTKFDQKKGEKEQTQVNVKDPVIVFFANATIQVMSAKRAERKGFLRQPEILNFAQVQDQHTPAGRYKNAIREKDRLEAWMDLENMVISKCEQRSGHPLPLDCRYSTTSIYLDPIEKEIAA